jgi:triacylglycerol lipase
LAIAAASGCSAEPETSSVPQEDAGADAAVAADAGTPDVGTIDAGAFDAGEPDAGEIADAGEADAGVEDAGIEDAGEPDAGPAMVWLDTPEEPLARCSNEMIAFGFRPEIQSFDIDNAFWMMWAARRSFRHDWPATEREWEYLGYRYRAFQNSSTGIQGYVAGNERAVIIAFRGSGEMSDYLANASFPQVDGARYGVAGKVHVGFANALDSAWQSIEETLRIFRDRNQPIWITGHSLGGAMATLAGARLVGEGKPVAGIYGFAPPRAGDVEFAEDVLARLSGRTFRFVNGPDLTPRVPPAGVAAAEAAYLMRISVGQSAAESLLRNLNYAHASTMLRFDDEGNLTRIGTSGDWEDKEFWTQAAQAYGGFGNILTVVGEDQAHKERHDPQSYLCKMNVVRKAGWVLPPSPP